MIRRLKQFLPKSWWMKRAWEKRARENAMFYVADFREDWENDLDAFFATGVQDVDRILDEAHWSNTTHATLLEVGCGVGRMTRHLATRFQSVVAVDISSTMIEKARTLNASVSNVAWHVTSGTSVRPVPDASVDFALSYIVLQHIPSDAVILNLVDDVLRVLRTNGRFRFQFRNDFAHGVPDTYNGASVALDDLRRVAARHQRPLANISGEGTHYCWAEIGPQSSTTDGV